jgi:hypothetical protein
MKLRIALIASALALSGAPAMAAPVNGTTTAAANIVSANQVLAQRTLEFGSIARPTTGTSTIVVASAASGAATPTVSGGNAFRITGSNGQTYSVQTNTLTFTNSSGNLSAIAAESPVASSGTLNTLPASGQDDLFVGGRFDITPTTTIQAYSGTLSLTINFN